MCQIVSEQKPLDMQVYFKLDGKDLVATKRFLLKMLSARWYTRAWCAHKCKVNQHAKINNHLFLCFGGDGSELCFEFRFIQYLAWHTCTTEYDYGVPEGDEAFLILDGPAGGTSLFNGQLDFSN
jgi:hypothetical protein